MLVLRLGLTSVFLSPESQCRRTAPQLYQTATVFVSLTLGAWSVVLFGYVIPFICVIIILTRNGYVSTSDMVAWGNVFPNGSRGAPEGTIDLLKVISMDEAPEAECCVSIMLFCFTSSNFSFLLVHWISVLLTSFIFSLYLSTNDQPYCTIRYVWKNSNLMMLL